MQLIPSMDLLGGRIVRLRHGDRKQVTYYDWTAKAWIERQEWYASDGAAWRILPLEMPEAVVSPEGQADYACGVKP